MSRRIHDVNSVDCACVDPRVGEDRPLGYYDVLYFDGPLRCRVCGERAYYVCETCRAALFCSAKCQAEERVMRDQKHEELCERAARRRDALNAELADAGYDDEEDYEEENADGEREVGEAGGEDEEDDEDDSDEEPEHSYVSVGIERVVLVDASRKRRRASSRRMKAAKWISPAIKRPGALRRTARRLGFIRSGQRLNARILDAMERYARKRRLRTMLRRVLLAKTLATFR